IGMHWNQWKVENQTGSMQSPHDVVDQYTSFFDGFKQAWGGAAFSIMLYKPRSTLYTRNFWGGNSTHFDDLVNGFNLLNVSTPSIYQLIDVSESTYVYGNHYYNSTTPDFTHGIFNSADTVH
ncbi:MAG: hypothetical protein ACXWJK_14395, partial [Burkholderiaceae bacterium]